MTLKDHHTLPKGVLRRIARLMHVYHQTRPERIAERFGVSLRYVYQQYSETPVFEMAPLSDVLEYLNGETDLRKAQQPPILGLRAAGPALSDREPEPCAECGGPSLGVRHTG